MTDRTYADGATFVVDVLVDLGLVTQIQGTRYLSKRRAHYDSLRAEMQAMEKMLKKPLSAAERHDMWRYMVESSKPKKAAPRKRRTK